MDNNKLVILTVKLIISLKKVFLRFYGGSPIEIGKKKAFYCPQWNDGELPSRKHGPNDIQCVLKKPWIWPVR